MVLSSRTVMCIRGGSTCSTTESPLCVNCLPLAPLHDRTWSGAPVWIQITYRELGDIFWLVPGLLS